MTWAGEQTADQQVEEATAASFYQTISFKDENLYEAIRDILDSYGMDYSGEEEEGYYNLELYKKDILRVKNLRLDSKNIADISGIEQFTGLKMLNLNDNKIVDVSNLTASNLPDLQELYLGKNRIEKVSNLYGLTNLTELGIGCNRLDDKDLVGITSLTNLERLSLGKEMIRSSGSEENYTKIVENNNKFTDYTEILKCTWLKELSLSGLELTAADQFFIMPNLRRLNVNQNHIIDMPEKTETLTNVWASAQKIYVTVEEKQRKIDLYQYPLLKKAVGDGASIYFAQEKYKLTNCTLASNLRYLTVNAGCAEAELMLLGGRANQTKLIITVQKSDIANSKVSGMKFSSKTGSITLSWKKVTGATGYQIYGYNGKTKKWSKVSTAATNKVTLKKLSSGTTYKYRVRAIAAINGKTKAGKFSSTLTAVTKPAAPVLKGKAKTGSASLTWKKVKGASEYRIYMATKKNGTYKRVKTIAKGATVSYKKTGLTKGKTYYFKMRALKKVGGNYYSSTYSKIQKMKITK